MAPSATTVSLSVQLISDMTNYIEQYMGHRRPRGAPPPRVGAEASAWRVMVSTPHTGDAVSILRKNVRPGQVRGPELAAAHGPGAGALLLGKHLLKGSFVALCL